MKHRLGSGALLILVDRSKGTLDSVVAQFYSPEIGGEKEAPRSAVPFRDKTTPPPPFIFKIHTNTTPAHNKHLFHHHVLILCASCMIAIRYCRIIWAVRKMGLGEGGGGGQPVRWRML
jgi:hypothetical protein